MMTTLRIKARGFVNRARGRGDQSGLTVPCNGRCGDTSPHDAHLAPGALDYLGR